jgi:hypothetical protein
MEDKISGQDRNALWRWLAIFAIPSLLLVGYFIVLVCESKLQIQSSQSFDSDFSRRYNITRSSIDEAYDTLVSERLVISDHIVDHFYYIDPLIFSKLPFEDKRSFLFILYCRSCYILQQDVSFIYVRDNYTGRNLAKWDSPGGFTLY